MKTRTRFFAVLVALVTISSSHAGDVKSLFGSDRTLGQVLAIDPVKGLQLKQGALMKDWNLSTQPGSQMLSSAGQNPYLKDAYIKVEYSDQNNSKIKTISGYTDFAMGDKRSLLTLDDRGMLAGYTGCTFGSCETSTPQLCKEILTAPNDKVNKLTACAMDIEAYMKRIATVVGSDDYQKTLKEHMTVIKAFNKTNERFKGLGQKLMSWEETLHAFSSVLQQTDACKALKKAGLVPSSGAVSSSPATEKNGDTLSRTAR